MFMGHKQQQKITKLHLRGLVLCCYLYTTHPKHDIGNKVLYSADNVLRELTI